MTDQSENPQPAEIEQPESIPQAEHTVLDEQPAQADLANSAQTANREPADEILVAAESKKNTPAKITPPANHQPLSHTLDTLHHRDWLRWLFLPVLLIGLGIIALAIAVNHYQPVPPQPPPLTTILVPQTPPVILKSTPAPTHAAAPATPPVVIAPVPEKHVAPPGVYYLKKHISVTTNDGVYGVEAGAQVLLLQKKGDTYQVTNGPHDFEINAGDLTNDLDEAKRIIQQTLANGHAVEPPMPSGN